MAKFNVIARLVGVLVLLGATQSFAAGGAALEHVEDSPRYRNNSDPICAIVSWHGEQEALLG